MSSIQGPDYTTAATSPSGVSWWWYAGVLLRYRRFIACFALSCALLVGMVTYLRPRQYTASVTFALQQSQAPQSSLSQLAVQFGVPASGGGGESPQFYADLIRSRGILRSVLTSEYRLEGPEPFERTLVQYLEVDGDTPAELLRSALEELNSRLRVTTDPITGTIGYEVDMPDPELAQEVASRILVLLNEFNLEKRQDQAHAERVFLEQRLTDAQESLAQAESALAGFYDRNRQFTQGPRPASPLASQESSLQRQIALRSQLYVSLAESLEQARLKEVRNTPVITVLERPEGFVVKQPRGTIRNAILALLVGGLASILLAFMRQFVVDSRERDLQEYREFTRLWNDSTNWLRLPIRSQISDPRLGGSIKRESDE